MSTQVVRLDDQSPPAADRALVRAALIGVVSALLLWLAMVATIVPRPYQLGEGEVSGLDLQAPARTTYVSQVRTRQEQERAAAAVSEVFEIDLELVNRQRKEQTGFLQSIAAAREQSGASLADKAAAIALLGSPTLGETIATQIVGLDDRRWLVVASEAQRLLQDVLKDRIGEPTVSQVTRELPLRVRDQLGEVEGGLAVQLAARFVRPNLEVNADATELLRQEARGSVAPIQITVERGESVLRGGQVVTAADLEKLETLGLLNPVMDWRALGGAALLAFACMAALSAYIYVLEPTLVRRERRLVLITLLLLIIVLAAKIVLPARPLWMYVFPLPAIAMLLAGLLDARLAIVVTSVASLLVASVIGGSAEMATLGIVGGIVGAVGAWRRERLDAYFFTGIAVGVSQALIVASFFLSARRDDWTLLGITGFEAIVNGLLSALLAVGAVYILGRAFGITTTMQLLELANPTQPLLRRLLMEAPGTYHHSIMVGNLGERAAEEIGADPLLVRVAAYYHDIGKLERPYFFIENQANSTNPHESLSPRTSARIIASHISDGLALAEQYRLPPRIRELIPQHHGTRAISFFFQKASESQDARLDPEQFRYPGPKPQSKEAAILMLADSTEAAARASKDHSPEALSQLVGRIIMQRLEEGQFDECDLTLRDLNSVKRAFCTLLGGIYHPRIEYPPQTVELPTPTADAPR